MAAPDAILDASAQEVMRLINKFLDDEDDDGVYRHKIQQMMDRHDRRLLVDVGDLRRYSAKLADELLKRPGEMLPYFEKGLLQIVNNMDPSYLTKLAFHGTVGDAMGASTDREAKVFVGFDGSFGSHLVSPRTLSSQYLTHLVAVEGIVTKCSLVRPKVAKSVHYCPATHSFTEREYRDATDMTGLPTGSTYPTKDAAGNALETEFGLSLYKDHQTFTLQEMPERSPLGQLPRSVDVIMDNDLVDKAKPGDRVQVVGVYRALAGTASTTSGVFKTVLIANSVRLLGKETQGVTLTPEDVTAIRNVSKRKDVFHVLARSLAPSIFGHEHIKQAMLLLLLGGAEKNLENGTHLRGDINILMVGDPSTAKSQMLRFVLGIAPLAVNTTGRGSSGVGLTAAVTHDPETGERRLEAGAMVLADRGVVCIDEFDKMSDVDRVAIHEVMEQQTVTIAKAGIQASLNARCSVVAAANPIYGQYDPSLTPQKNVHLPDSLLSRFDLMFIVQDSMDEARDRSIAEHVLRMHRYVKPGHEGVPIPLDAIGAHADDGGEAADAATDADPWEKFNPLLHGGAAQAVGSAADGRKRPVELLKIAFLKKYISYAKARVKPELSDGARELIVQHYAELRQKQVDGGVTMPITARALETIIRLSTAHAKSRLSKWIEVGDVKVAFGLMEFALHHDSSGVSGAVAARRRKKRAVGDGDVAGGAGDGDVDDDDEGGGDVPAAGDEGKAAAGGGDVSDDDVEEDAKAAPGKGKPTPTRAPGSSKSVQPSPTAKAAGASPARASARAQQQLAAASASKKRGRDEPTPSPSAEREPSSDAAPQEPRIPVNRDDPAFKSFMSTLATRARLERLVSAPLTKVLEWVQTDRLNLTRIQVVSFLSELDAMNRVMYAGSTVHFL